MSRRITSGVVGRQVLGSIKTINNRLEAVEANGDLVLDANGSSEAISGSGISRSATNFQIDNGASLILAETGSTHGVALKSPDVIAADITYTLPGTITDNNFLKTNASGTLSWAAVAVDVSNQTADPTVYYPTFITETSGTAGSVNVSNTKLSFVPSTGTLTATALVESSSVTLKENITPVENALDAIMKLSGVLYDRKDGSSKNEAGFIAEDVNKILPNLVTKDNSGNPHGINYTKFSVYLVEAIKSMQQEIINLKTNK